MSLLTDLISYWPLNEASGSALDSHGANGLALGVDPVGSGVGKVYATARDLEVSSDTQYFTIASNASLQTGDINFSAAVWFLVEDFTAGTFRCIMGKQNTGLTVTRNGSWMLPTLP